MVMRTPIPILVAATLVLAPAVTRAADAPAVERFGVYVLADNVDRSAAFYEKLFGKPPQVRTPALVGFDVAGGFYAVASRKAFGAGVPAGSAATPYLRVADVDAWLARVQAQAPELVVTPGVLREGPLSLIKFKDPDGNLVEMYAVKAPSK